MSAFSALFASLLASWPAPVAVDADVVSGPVSAVRPAMAADDPLAVWQRITQEFRDSQVAQVRIERHFRWRIIPVPGPARESMMAVNPLPPSAPRMTERKMGDCIAMSSIAGGRPHGGSRLLLFLRDRRLVAADLEKACSARDFYSGFYVDKPHEDGKLCADRDRIQARSGARCEISRFRLLVVED